MAGEVTPGLRALLAKQQCFAVEYWGADSDSPDYRDRDTADLNEAHVVSSADRATWNKPKVKIGPVTQLDDLFGLEEYEVPLHRIVIDVDHQAHLVESSTPGHHHLYVEIPPVPWDDYVKWLEASALIGLVSPGYVNACISRGHSDVRLPWIHKGEPGDIPLPWDGKDFFCCRCHREPQEIGEYRSMAQDQKDSEGTVATKSGERDIAPDEEAVPVNDYDIKAWVWHNEGTMNRENGLFACTACYIAMGQPSSGRGWRPDSYELEPQDPNVPDGPDSPPEIPVVPVENLGGLY